MGLRRTAEAHIGHFGCAAGRWDVKREAPSYKRLTLATVVEKPTVEYAQANLATPGLKAGEYLTAFGLYVIEHTVFSYLSEMEHVRESVGPTAGPLHLTPALDKIRQEAGLDGIMIDGERYDIGGDPHDYLKTLNALAPAEGTPETMGQPYRTPSMVFGRPAAAANPAVPLA